MERGNHSFRTIMCFLFCINFFAVLFVVSSPGNLYSQRIIADKVIAGKTPESLTMMLEPYLEKYGLPALGAAVVKDGRMIAIGAAGTRKAGQKIPVTPGDRFHIGSDTKAMTALLAAMFVEQGKLRWDSRLEEIFPELGKTMTQNMGSITLEQLLSHSSGMPGDDEPLAAKLLAESSARPDDNLTDTRYWMLSRWVSQPLGKPLGTKYSYSNMGYVLVGAILEKISGKSWEELVIERIFVPLKLRSAGFGPQSSLGRIDAPLPHRIVEGKVKPMMAGISADNPIVVGPAGTVHLSLQDFARWAAWNAGKGKRGPLLIKPETFTKLMTPVIDVTPPKDAPPGTPSPGRYAFGWEEVKLSFAANETFIVHGGSNEMNLAHIILQPGKDFAMVLLTNIGGKKANEALSSLGEELYKRYGNR
ncbi:MAG: serine hydrolase domain-containing protein [Syntrophorhabdaceae bacterium]